MKKPNTYLLRKLLCTLGLGLGVTAAEAAYTPIVVTGFNQDVIANGTGTSVSSTTYDVDGAAGTGYTFMAPNFVNPAGLSPTSFLPASGLITSAVTSGLTYQLASYSANNSLRLPLTGSGVAATGTLTLATPRTAGEVYALVTSGGSASTVTVTITFTDGTTQVLAAQTVSDWYDGANPVMLGLGRAGRDATSTIDNNTTNPRLYQIRIPVLAANYPKLVQSIGFNKTSTAGVLNVFGISVNSLCSGAPTAGTAVATVSTTCGSTGTLLSLTGATTDVGITYQWQSSTDNGTTWTSVTGATAATYTVAGLTTPTLYRAQVTCSGLTANSTSVTVGVTVTPYATLPFTESFENTWVNGCDTRDVPSAFWRNAPATGNNSWRREDDGAAAAWTSATTGGYTPVSSAGSHSARFHSYFASANAIGTLDLLVNLSGAGAKRLSFDYVNTSGSDSLTVQISEDGGTTFNRLGGYILSSTFTSKVLTINSTSPTAILRFRARSDFGATDIGVDNIVLESATGCLTPANLTATTTTTTASLSWLTGGTGTYTVLYGPTGFNPALPSSTTNVYTTVSSLTAPPYSVTGLAPGTTYQFYVRLNCAGSTTSGTAGPVSFTTQIVNDEPCGATLLPVNNTCTPISSTTVGATATATSAGIPAGTCTSAPTTAPLDVWFQFTTAATGPTSTQVRISVTGTAANTLRAYSATACTGAFTFLSCATSTSTTTATPNLDLTNLTPSTTYYVRVAGYSTSTTTLGNFTICATPVPNCPAPTGLTAGTLTNTTATVSWTAVSGGTGSTYTVIYGPTGFSPTGGGTSVTGITGTSTTLTGLSANSPYQFYVQQICGGFNGSSTLTGPISFNTPLTAPLNDDPCGAVALTSGTVSGSNVGATTSIQNGINTPTCAGGPLPKDIWFTFTPSGTSTTLTFTGTTAGAMRLFTSPSCSAGPFNQVFCQGSGTANTALGVVTVPGLTAGTRYYLAVSGYTSSDALGTFTVAGTALLANKVQAETSALQVYPNPSSTGQFTLKLSTTSTGGQATLLNALGQRVLTKNLAAGTAEQTLSTRGLAAGLYTLRVQVGGEALTRKVVLE